MNEKKSSEGLSLVKFETKYLMELFCVVTDNTVIDWENKELQKIIDREIELATVEWYYYRFLHGSNPDELLYCKLLEKFVKNQLPLLSSIKFEQDKKEFVERHVENLIKENCLIKENFSSEDFSFICESERYYAKQYYEKNSLLSLGYQDLDIRTSVKCKVAGICELKECFKYRYNKIYSNYEH